MDPLFPALPEDLSALSNEELQTLLDEHLAAQRLIRANDPEFLGDLTASQIVAQAEIGKEQTAALKAEQTNRAEFEANYETRIAELTADAAEGDDAAADADPDAAELSTTGDDPAGDDADDDDDDGDDAAAGEPPADPDSPDALSAAAAGRQIRRPMPEPDRARQGGQNPEELQGAVLVAAAGLERVQPGTELTPQTLTSIMLEKAKRLGRPHKTERGIEERYLLASAQYRFPESRRLTSDLESNAQKIRLLQNTEGKSLVASGGLCAPLTPLYTIPQFAVTDRPVRDALPSFNADRGGVNVPTPTTLASAFDAITIISEADDALGGTFATKSCLDQTCLEYVETAVTIISHCREYGNLNARAWPESVTFENELTMAEHARVADSFLLDRIKALSINVTTADVYSTTHDLIYAITRAAAGIRYRLRAANGTRLRALLPSWVPDMMVADIAATQFDRFVSRQRVTQILRDAGVEPTFYIDGPTTGTSQGFADETASALDDFPDAIQWALYIEGAFIHVDGGTLELGLVRDSTLNSTNDFQYFGESFENVARLGPVQSALWITSTVCPSGEFPALTTALSC